MKKYFISLLLVITVINLSAQVITKKTTKEKVDSKTIIFEA